MRRTLLKAATRILIGVGFGVFVFWIMLAQPSFRSSPVSRVTCDPVKLRGHVETLSRSLSPRDWRHTEQLSRCADYIEQHFREAGATVEIQPFTIGNRNYRNVIGRFNAGKGNRIIVGAHYDACGEMPGADDNASGVAALIELGYLLGKNPTNSAVDLVAYSLEEPPFFRTPEMGSALHAKIAAEDRANIRGVIVLEMVGCFKDEFGSQGYPMPLLHLLYPSRGDFISVVGRWDQGDWIQAVKRGMQGTTALPVYSIRGPAAIPGIDFSDHMNYWPYGINALMITDTAFYRNPAYHAAQDTPDKLDYTRMGMVVISVFEAISSKHRLVDAQSVSR